MITWILIIGFGLSNLWLLYYAFWSAHLIGSGAAQADMELFSYLTMLGGTTVIGSVLILLIGYLVNIKTIKLNVALLRNPVVVASVLNIAIPVFLYVYLRT